MTFLNSGVFFSTTRILNICTRTFKGFIINQTYSRIIHNGEVNYLQAGMETLDALKVPEYTTSTINVWKVKVVKT